MLGFSFPSAGASSVMSLEGHTFRQLHLAGLQESDASLLMTTAPGGWLVQVRLCSCLVVAVYCLLSLACCLLFGLRSACMGSRVV
jgi:hypothetical protein